MYVNPLVGIPGSPNHNQISNSMSSTNLASSLSPSTLIITLMFSDSSSYSVSPRFESLSAITIFCGLPGHLPALMASNSSSANHITLFSAVHFVMIVVWSLPSNLMISPESPDNLSIVLAVFPPSPDSSMIL